VSHDVCVGGMLAMESPPMHVLGLNAHVLSHRVVHPSFCNIMSVVLSLRIFPRSYQKKENTEVTTNQSFKYRL